MDTKLNPPNQKGAPPQPQPKKDNLNEEHQTGAEVFLNDQNDFKNVQTVKEGQSLLDYLHISFLNTEERQEQFSILMSSSFKTALFMILEWVPSIVQLYFIGQIDDDDKVGGFGMGLVWSNCFAVGLFGGLGIGVETLAAFAYGADKYKMTGVIFQRGLMIATVAMIPISFFMSISDDVISSISGKPLLGYYASIYCQYGLLSFYLNGVYNIFKGYLTAQNEYSLPLITVSITATASIFLNYLFIQFLDFGIAGAAFARTFTETANVSIILFLVIKNKIDKRCPIKITKLAFCEWINFLKFAIPIGSLLTLEWISYELFSFQASHLNSSDFNAHVIMNNVNTVYYQFACGVSIAMTTYIGNEMGSKCIPKAADYSKQGMIIILTFLVATQLPFSMLRDQFITWFSVNLETQASLNTMFPLFQACMILDAFLIGITGITRGIGKQNFSAGSFIVSYLGFGQIIAYVSTFVFDFGLFGIWGGIVFGICCTALCQVWCIGYSDWKVLLSIIQSNLEKDEKKNRELMNDEHMDEESNRQAMLAEEELKRQQLADVTIEMKQIRTKTKKQSKKKRTQLIEQEQSQDTENAAGDLEKGLLSKEDTEQQDRNQMENSQLQDKR